MPQKKLDAVVLPLVACLHQWSPSVTVLLVNQMGMLLHEVLEQLEIAKVGGDVSLKILKSRKRNNSYLVYFHLQELNRLLCF